MTLYGAFVGSDTNVARDVESWLGERLDGFLAYTWGWDPNNWEGLRPLVVTEMPGKIGETGRRMLWSIMLILDGNHENLGQSVEWYRQAARGERNALYENIGRDLTAYHDRIGDTGPIYVRSVWEIPGEWFMWNKAAVADVPAYKGAWRQFATSLRKTCPRVKIVWDFNSDRGAVEHLYPGDDVVDVISQDIYWNYDLQGRDPVAAFRHSRHVYSRGLQWHLDWCKARGKPMAISEFGVKITGEGASLDITSWFREFFAFVDEVNQQGNPGMAYVTLWESGHDNVGKVSTDMREPHRTNVRDMFRARLPGSIVGGGVTPPPPLPPPPNPTFPPANITHGAGTDSLILLISQQEYQGSAQYRVLIDGVQIGPVLTASALRSSAQSDTLTLKGNWAAGSHQVRVEFLNDLYGWAVNLDRNLYIDAATINGVNISGVRQDILGSDVPALFAFTKAGTVQPPPPPPPTTDWQAEAQRLLGENTTLKAQVASLTAEKAAVTAQNGKLKANAVLAIMALNTPI